jgi:hypothetical protein
MSVCELAIGAQNAILERIEVLLTRHGHHTLVVARALCQSLPRLARKPKHRFPVNLLYSVDGNRAMHPPKDAPRSVLQRVEHPAKFLRMEDDYIHPGLLSVAFCPPRAQRLPELRGVGQCISDIADPVPDSLSSKHEFLRVLLVLLLRIGGRLRSFGHVEPTELAEAAIDSNCGAGPSTHGLR